MNFQAYSLQSHPEWACIHVKTPDSEARTPVHLVCAIDTSGSMKTDFKLENVKRSLQFLLDFLGPNDKISIITFSDVARTIISQVAVTSTEKDNIRAHINIINIEDRTNISASIIASQENLMFDATTFKQGILLLTDGVANMGVVQPEGILEIVSKTMNKFSGTSISCVGYGTDHNVELLQTISSTGGGSYYVVNNLEDVANVFGDVLGGLMSCTAQQVRIILPVGTEVMTRYAKNVNGTDMEVVIGDLPAGSEGIVLAKIPTSTIVTLKGYDLEHHSSIELSTTVLNTDNEELQTNGEAHYIRFEVLTIIEQARSAIVRRADNTVITSLVNKITAATEQINTYRINHAHSLWNVLIHELDNCKQLLENSNNVGHDVTLMMSQHGAYLGMMRGIPVAMSQDPNDTTNVGRVFSNNVQRQISSQLQTSVSAVRHNNVNQDPTDVHTSTPHDRLRRQVACSYNSLTASTY